MVLLYQFVKRTYYFLQLFLKGVLSLLYHKNIQSVPEVVNYLVVVVQKIGCFLHFIFLGSTSQPTVLYVHFESAVHY